MELSIHRHLLIRVVSRRHRAIAVACLADEGCTKVVALRTGERDRLTARENAGVLPDLDLGVLGND